MTFAQTIENLMAGSTLTQQEAYNIMLTIGEGGFNEVQNTALIIALSSRDLILDEIIGFRNALLDLSIPTSLINYTTIDLCGTGGDEKDTFNISTLASFVVASAGYKVAKHGNYSVSSTSGSSNILEKLGYVFSNDSSKLERELNELNICFLHAPLFHPALKNVSSARKQLGIKTIFNILGPLVNPAKNKKQFVGVYSLKLARLYNYLLQNLGKEYAIVHALDGYDEISLTGNALCFASDGEKVLRPDHFGMQQISQESLFGGATVDDALTIFLNVAKNVGTQQQTNAVLANAALGIQCFEPHKSLLECVDLARETVQSGQTNRLITNLIAIQ